jgi:predicted  nucleic acid-binding Zn-ribbon protein
MFRRSKQAYLAAAAEELRNLRDRMESLRRSSRRLESGQVLMLERALDDLRGRGNRVEARLEEVRRAAEDAWTTLRPRSEAALDDLRAGVRHLESLLDMETA